MVSFRSHLACAVKTEAQSVMISFLNSSRRHSLASPYLHRRRFMPLLSQVRLRAGLAWRLRKLAFGTLVGFWTIASIDPACAETMLQSWLKAQTNIQTWSAEV